ncbi:Ig-like domain-containing protein [Pseudomonas sp. CFBP 13715]|uniref:Ig-like domain-containing protein n=1 Tax=Pseudomonas sp. CFBP 13715 TaxID=2775306 RepID=UPI00387ECF29
MILDGLYVRGSPEWTLNGSDTAGNTQVRKASGGTPPYTYSSSSTRYASVDSQGKVKGRGWGNSTITVTDALNQNVRYTVNVSNVYVMRQ